MLIEEVKGKISRLLKNRSFVYRAGIVLVAMSALIILLTYFPIIKEELKYQLSAKNNNVPVLTGAQNTFEIKSVTGTIQPVDENFGIVIPKISANARVVPDVDPNNAKIYQQALTQGVAQAAGSANPDEPGNIFIFAHSGVDFYEALHYNAVFYLLDKLENNDKVYVFYKGRKISYKVSDKKVVASTDVKYFAGEQDKKTLTLMTCWPPGTTWQRLVVVAHQTDAT